MFYADREQGRAARQIKTFPVPLDVIGESAVADAMPVFGRLDRVIAHFDAPARMRADAVAEMARRIKPDFRGDEPGFVATAK